MTMTIMTTMPEIRTTIILVIINTTITTTTSTTTITTKMSYVCEQGHDSFL